MRLNRKGFTLIELIMVVIIIGVLAAIAAPLMQKNVRAAKASEAMAALGAIRTAERCYFVDKGTYVNVLATQWDSGGLRDYVRANDLKGQYFSANDYVISSAGTIGYMSRASGNTSGSTAPARNEVQGIVCNMDQDGNTYQSY